MHLDRQIIHLFATLGDAALAGCVPNKLVRPRPELSRSSREETERAGSTSINRRLPFPEPKVANLLAISEELSKMILNQRCVVLSSSAFACSTISARSEGA